MNDLFEKEKVAKAYFKLALPVVFSNVISLIYNMVDTYFIAMTKDTNLIAGVALGSPIFILMIALGDIFGLGGSSVISRLFGSKQNEDATIIAIGAHMLRAMLIGVPFMVMMLASVVTFQASGKAMNSLILSLSRQGVIFVIVINLAFHFWGYEGIVFSQTISDILTSVIASVLLMRFMLELKKEF